MNPTTGSTKRSQAKTAPKDAASKGPRKTLTVSRKKSAAKQEPLVVGMTAEPPVDMSGIIATTAFYLAAERDFAPGRELDDWLEAERRVRAQFGA